MPIVTICGRNESLQNTKILNMLLKCILAAFANKESASATTELYYISKTPLLHLSC